MLKLGPPKDVLISLVKKWVPQFLETDWDNCVVSQWEGARVRDHFRIMVGFHHRHDLNPQRRVLHMKVDSMDELRKMFYTVEEVEDGADPRGAG